MANYLAGRIIAGVFTYTEVITKYPKLKTQIDNVLVERGHGHLIVEV